jgi:hypothetical protein
MLLSNTAERFEFAKIPNFPEELKLSGHTCFFQPIVPSTYNYTFFIGVMPLDS